MKRTKNVRKIAKRVNLYFIQQIITDSKACFFQDDHFNFKLAKFNDFIAPVIRRSASIANNCPRDHVKHDLHLMMIQIMNLQDHH